MKISNILLSLILISTIFVQGCAFINLGQSTSKTENPDDFEIINDSVISGSFTTDPAYDGVASDGTLLKTLTSIPEYKDNGDKMFIYTFQEPRASYDKLDGIAYDMAEAGFTAAFTWGYEKKYKESFENNGVYWMPHIGMTTPNSLHQDLHPDNISDNVVGFFYKDEPSFDEISELIPLAENHVTFYDDKLFYVNLNPYWEGNETNVDSFHYGYTYDEYVEEFCNKVFSVIDKNRVISVDFYPLMQDGTQRNVWLYTYETVAKYAKEFDATLMFYICSTEHYGYRRLDLANLRYMMNVGLTYGASAMSYFTYVTYSDQPFEHGLVSADGQIKYDTYYMAQTVNNECFLWDHIFMNFKWDETMCVYGKNELYENLQFNATQNSVDNIDIIESVEASRDTLIGKFTGANNEIGLMVTNFSDPVKGGKDVVKLTLKEANKAILYTNGVRSVVDVIDGELVLEIEPGEATFVIPLEIKN